MNNLPVDLQNVIVSFLYDLSYKELSEDLDFYTVWHQHVPSIFLHASLPDNRFWYSIPSPLLRHVPYYPRKYLRMTPECIWSGSLMFFLYLLDKKAVRQLKTYKRCILRWSNDVISNRHLEYWKFLYHNVLKKLEYDHFKVSRSAVPFVLLCLEQIASLQDASFSVPISSSL